MKLAELQVAAFTDLLASAAPAPGGGSAAALEGALGAALTAMVCSLTVSKKAYADYQELAEESLKRAQNLKARFLDGMERDNRAFNEFSAALSMPKTTDEEKAARSAAVQAGLRTCTETPLDMMELAVEALELTAPLLGRSNATAVSDLGVAALSLRASVQSAWLNVLINIGSMKDQELAAAYRQKGEKLLERALPLANEIYQETVRLL